MSPSRTYCIGLLGCYLGLISSPRVVRLLLTDDRRRHLDPRPDMGGVAGCPSRLLILRLLSYPEDAPRVARAVGGGRVIHLARAAWLARR